MSTRGTRSERERERERERPDKINERVRVFADARDSVNQFLQRRNTAQLR